MNEVYDFLKNCGTYFLATEDGSQPRVRAFGTIDLFEGKLYIQTGKSKDVFKQMQANPKVELCGVSKDGSQWIRVQAEAVNDDNRAAIVHMLDAYPSLKSMYSVDDGNTAVLYLKNGTATISSFTAAPKTCKF
jgi:uncharacterized pyridoxamine 5'-phosphate oxidase family protein